MVGVHSTRSHSADPRARPGRFWLGGQVAHQRLPAAGGGEADAWRGSGRRGGGVGGGGWRRGTVDGFVQELKGACGDHWCAIGSEIIVFWSMAMAGITAAMVDG